jgi:hypothetical protein
LRLSDKGKCNNFTLKGHDQGDLCPKEPTFYVSLHPLFYKVLSPKANCLKRERERKRVCSICRWVGGWIDDKKGKVCAL